MKIDLKEYEDKLLQRRTDRINYIRNWHPWFAWRPVMTLSRKLCWMRTVLRRQYYNDDNFYIEAIIKWEYKTDLFEVIKDAK